MEDNELEDIDNFDLEEEMYLRDIAEEEEAENENSEEIEVFEFDYRHQLTKTNLELDLSLNEIDRQIYSFKVDGVIYTGKVMCKMKDDNFIFNVTTKDDKIQKMKKFDINRLNQIK